MKRVFLSLFIITLFGNLIYADDIKDNTTQSISDEEFMKQMEELEQRQQKAKDETEKSKKELEASKKLGRTLDELLNRIEKINTHERK